MLVKLVVLACSLAASHAAWNGPLAGGQPASLYPAGVSPQACPNFPHCSNPAVAANPGQPATYNNPQWNSPQPQWNQWNNPQPQWNQGSQWNNPQPSWNQNNWNPQPVPQYSNDIQQRLNRGEYVGDGDYHGEGLAEALAPGYGGWQNQGGWSPSQNYGSPPGAQQAHGVGQIPAGVDARSCPNYPFCS